MIYIGLVLLSILLVVSSMKHFVYTKKPQETMKQEVKKSTKKEIVKSKSKKASSIPTKSTQSSSITQYTTYNGKKVVDWTKPTGEHPDLTSATKDQLSIEVNQEKQRVYIRKDGQIVSTLVVSTGVDGNTPNGNFVIEPEHGEWFYNNKPDIQEGAEYYVSFHQHGVYLFHTVPMDKNKQLVPEKLGKLGQPNSHGCIQMSLPDAKWFYETFTQWNKVGTPVTVK